MKKYLLPAMLLLTPCVYAADANYTLILKDHRFQPTEITIPAGVKARIVIENRDDEVDEFDSRALDREKVITGHGKATVIIGPLSPGRYPFQGEYHADTAQGAVIIK